MAINQLKGGAALSYITIFLTNIIGLFLTPYILKMLGTAEYGLYILIGAFVGYMSVLDLGLNNTIVRFVAKYRAEGDRKGEENFLALSMVTYACISVLVIIIGFVCYLNIDEIFGSSLTFDEIQKAKVMFIILIFNLAITLPGGSLRGICTGYEEFILPRTVNIFRYLLRSGVLVAILFFGGKAISIVILDTVMNILIIGVNATIVFGKLKVRIKLHRFDSFLLKEMLGYSSFIFVFAIVQQFQWRVGQVVLGIITDTTLVAIYAIGVMLGTYYGAFSGAISGVFLPRATQMVVSDNTGETLTDMMIRIGRISFIILLYILIAFILFGRQFILLWVGPEYLESWQIALCIMCAMTLPLIQGFGSSILEAKNKLAFKAYINLSMIVIGTAIGIALVKVYGATGMILGISFSLFTFQLIMNVYYHRVIGLNIYRFYKQLSHKIIMALCLILVPAYFLSIMDITTWLSFVFVAAIYTVIYAVFMYKIGMIQSEKDLFSQIFKPALSFFFSSKG
ncbi:oligosaccharide flippase family protein [Ancylomarina sp. 16SWW S1-10-2]|uniref:oligosaccharide flippase family protein n=1 Tax=Ancylomarina sp. 16SWW S1-10-2 TaxID=2499681 RepID=UPI0012AE30EC|nr:oligosaccharide flippase family protein [Ancylomarina sp. 16SWW S1-10-2]MRT93436.1 polysaccharide biosynthesis protein [Ancylomarina sp. 16SWW S1-10-2]